MEEGRAGTKSTVKRRATREVVKDSLQSTPGDTKGKAAVIAAGTGGNEEEVVENKRNSGPKRRLSVPDAMVHDNNDMPPVKIRRTQSDSGAGRDILGGGGGVGVGGVGVAVGSGGGEESSVLPWFEGRNDAHRRITPETLAALLDGAYDHLLDEYHVIDCRFPYEFEGGHIAGAKNVNTKKELDELFFQDAPTANNNSSSNSKRQAKDGKRLVVVMHCEFSSHRAPTM
ncbi:cell division cycle- protein [Rhizophlyctis rosea]|nr:cell division cycle- protein [Rhizophlyctis rosea]